MDEIEKKKAELLRDNQKMLNRSQMFDAPKYNINPDVKLPEWVKCIRCGKGPTGYDWLKPVNPAPDCRELIHLGCIDKDLPRLFESQMGGHGVWPG